MAAVVIPPEQAPSTLTEGACDPAGDGEGLLGLLDVAQEVPLALLGARVAPADREHLLSLRDGVLDQTAAGGEVEDVVLVDLRHYDERVPQHPGRRRGTGSARARRCGGRRTGLAAVVCPTVNGSVSTIDGMRPLCRRSPTKLRAPAIRLRPRVSRLA